MRILTIPIQANFGGDPSGQDRDKPHWAQRDRARKLLAEAGFPGGDGFPRYSMLISRPSARTSAEAIQAMWKQHLGILVDIENKDWGSTFVGSPLKVGAAILDTNREMMEDLSFGSSYRSQLSPSPD